MLRLPCQNARLGELIGFGVIGQARHGGEVAMAVQQVGGIAAGETHRARQPVAAI